MSSQMNTHQENQGLEIHHALSMLMLENALALLDSISFFHTSNMHKHKSNMHT